MPQSVTVVGPPPSLSSGDGLAPPGTGVGGRNVGLALSVASGGAGVVSWDGATVDGATGVDSPGPAVPQAALSAAISAAARASGRRRRVAVGIAGPW